MSTLLSTLNEKKRGRPSLPHLSRPSERRLEGEKTRPRASSTNGLSVSLPTKSGRPSPSGLISASATSSASMGASSLSVNLMPEPLRASASFSSISFSLSADAEACNAAMFARCHATPLISVWPLTSRSNHDLAYLWLSSSFSKRLDLREFTIATSSKTVLRGFRTVRRRRAGRAAARARSCPRRICGRRRLSWFFGQSPRRECPLR